MNARTGWNPREVKALHETALHAQQLAEQATHIARGIDDLVEQGVLTHEAALFACFALKEGRHIGVVTTKAERAQHLVRTLAPLTGCNVPDQDAVLWQRVLSDIDTAHGAMYVMEAGCACHAMRALIADRRCAADDPALRLSAWLDLVMDLDDDGRVQRIAVVTGLLEADGLPSQALFLREGGVLVACATGIAATEPAAVRKS